MYETLFFFKLVQNKAEEIWKQHSNSCLDGVGAEGDQSKTNFLGGNYPTIFSNMSSKMPTYIAKFLIGFFSPSTVISVAYKNSQMGEKAKHTNAK